MSARSFLARQRTRHWSLLLIVTENRRIPYRLPVTVGSEKNCGFVAQTRIREHRACSASSLASPRSAGRCSQV